MAERLTIYMIRLARVLMRAGLRAMRLHDGVGRCLFMLGRYSLVASWWCQTGDLDEAIEREQQWVDALDHKIRLIKAGGA